MNLGDMKTTDGVAAVLQEDDDDAVDPHLERIKNEAGGDESDEEVNSSIHFLKLLLMKFADASAKFILFVIHLFLLSLAITYYILSQLERYLYFETRSLN